MDQRLPQSIRQQIRTRVLNMTIGQWMRAVDMVLEEHLPQNRSVEEEAEHVTKLALLLMLTRWYEEEDICLLLDSSALKLPTKIKRTDKFQLTRILDRPQGESGRIVDASTVPDADGPPMHD